MKVGEALAFELMEKQHEARCLPCCGLGIVYDPSEPSKYLRCAHCDGIGIIAPIQ